MNAAHIGQLAAATVSGTLPFPEIIGRLVDEGVESYRVDYRQLQFTFYGAQGGVVVAPLVIEGLPEVADTFDVVGLRAAIVDSQTRGQKFRDFSQRAMHCGVQSYSVYLTGRCVMYLGRRGEQHIERFPGAS